MVSKLFYLFISILVLIFVLLLNGDLNYIVYALSFECIDVNKLNLNLNNYDNAVEIVKNSILPSYLRTKENILLENEIYNTFNDTDYQLVLKKRVLFMSEYIKHQHWYYKYITTDVSKQFSSPIEKSKLINALMNEFYVSWTKEYNIFLKKILTKEV